MPPDTQLETRSSESLAEHVDAASNRSVLARTVTSVTPACMGWVATQPNPAVRFESIVKEELESNTVALIARRTLREILQIP